MQITPIYSRSAYGSECYLLTDSGHALVVDPSASTAAILREADRQGCTLDGILLTHGHFDHIMSIDALRLEHPDLPVYIHEKDAPMLEDGEKNAFTFFFGEDRRYRPADKLLHEGDRIPLGGSVLTVLHTPGHSPGSVCCLSADDGILITGDTLFADNIGRWDLWEGDYDTLRRSLGRLTALDPSLTIYPGHGEPARLGAALSRVAAFLP